MLPVVQNELATVQLVDNQWVVGLSHDEIRRVSLTWRVPLSPIFITFDFNIIFINVSNSESNLAI
jgi:hypothetical protein